MKKAQKKSLKVIYVAGPYRAHTTNGVYENIHRAREVALRIWDMGHVALCPHTNTAMMDGAVPDELFLEGTLELMTRCDAVVLVQGWEKSKGTLNEIKTAHALGIQVFDSIEYFEDVERGRG